MENEVKVEKKTIKGFIGSHLPEIVTVGVAVGTVVVIGLAIKAGIKPNIPDVEVGEQIVETLSAANSLEGYGIWAMVNGMDEKLVEFAPVLQKFVEDNGFTIMCDVM